MEQTLAIEADAELRQKWMALARDHHVLIAIQSDTHFAASLRSPERGERGNCRRLCFLPTETASHARRFHNHTVHWQCEHVGNDVLHFRRVLG